MTKQDRQGSRTPAALERKYGFGRRFQDQAQANRNQDDRTAAVAEQLQTHIRNSNTSLARLAQDLAQLRTGLSSLGDSHGALRQDMERSLGVINDTVGALLGTIERQQDTLEDLRRTAARQAEQLARAETGLTLQGSRLDRIEAALEADLQGQGLLS